MVTLLIRTVVLYALVFLVVRLMGKRQISDMQPFDLVITLFIAELASEPVSNSGIPLLYGVIPLLTLFVLHRTVAFISLKSQRIRALVCGHPVVAIEHGVVIESALKAMNCSLNDLTEQLRLKDAFALFEVEYAIIETNGSLSVIKKQNAAAASEPGEMLLCDGRPDEKALAALGYDEIWLKRKLAEAGIKRFGGCFFVMRQQDGTLHAQMKLRADPAPKAIIINAGSDNGKGKRQK